MCGRYTLVRLNDILEKFPWIERAPPLLAPRYNIAPTQPLLAITNDHPREFDHLYWGLVPSWAKDVSVGNRMINARSETLADKPTFRNALKRRRCLIPADGFYEWTTEPGVKSKLPVHIHMKDRAPFAFAGLWDTWHSADGSELRSCTIITTAPNELMKPLHDRMPAIIHPDHYQHWLVPDEREAEEFAYVVEPYPADEMEAVPMSRYVNSPKNEGSQCWESPAKESLF